MTLVLGTAALACSAKASAAGRYCARGNSGRCIDLTQNGQLIISWSGDVANYTIDGERIVASNPMFGAATGTIHSGEITFQGGGIVGATLQGTYVKH
jgi:hypothetical protein